MRTPKACFQCRSTKKKCDRLDYGLSCEQFLRKSVPCSYTIAPSTQQLPEITPRSNDETNSALILPKQTAQELLELYFYYIHDRPHSLFHAPTLKRSLFDGTINKALLYATCSFACRFHNDEAVRALGSQLTSEAKRLLNCDIENVCLEAVQTSLLIGSLSAAESNASSEALYCGIASRMAMILRLNITNQAESLIEQEVKRRVWWSLFMNDRWSSARLGLPRQIVDTMKFPDLPMDENSFRDLVASSIAVNWQPGLWAHMVTLVRLFGPIQDLNQSIASDVISDSKIETSVTQLMRELDLWEDMLPLHLKFNEVNLQKHVRKGVGGQFVALHLGHHHYATLLYFHSLDTPPTSRTQPLVDRCKNHASACSTLLRISRQTRKCEAVYTAVGQMAMVSSAVLLHTLLFGADDEVAEVRSSLSSNFESLVELRKYWPTSLGQTIERLFAFQNACLVSASPSTHKIDRWMVRFLLEHSLPLKAKADILDMATGSADGANLPSPHQRFVERGRLTNDALIGLLE